METNQIKTIIFDLDGVITSEKKYWNTSKLTVWELICSQDYLGINQYFGTSNDVSNVLVNLGEKIISSNFIYQLKSRAINSNWDLTFFVVCLHLVAIIGNFQEVQDDTLSQLLNQNDVDLKTKLNQLGQLIKRKNYNVEISQPIIEQFWQETKALKGAAVLEYVNFFISEKLGEKFSLFDSRGELWQLCYENFQAWYEGRKGYNLPDEETVLDLHSIEATLSTLHYSGRYTLAIATGRPRQEVIQPFTTWGLLQYFDPQRIVTYDEVLESESILSHSNQKIKLGKPHPFILFKAIYPEEDIRQLCAENFQLENGQEIAYIGDAGSDVVAAQRAGCISLGVLTGFGEGNEKIKKQQMLSDLGCDIILDSILELPNLLRL
ncbi:MAG TPA: phosphatase [Cyanothece sp. UBA12306]|nr:phosphatase [Cyanothece sp. UBA12306]